MSTTVIAAGPLEALVRHGGLKMSMTQRYAGMLRRHAGGLDKQEMPVLAESVRQAARHMEELQAAKDAISCPWKPMKDAPKDGTALLVLLDGADIPHAVRWMQADDQRGSGKEGWHVTWDGARLSDRFPLRYWMHCPDDPDA